MNVTLFIHKKYFYIENFNANSHLELCTHHGSFERRQMMADTVDTCMLCEVFMFMFNGGYFSGFILAHISFTAHATRLSVPTLFFHRIFLVLNVMSFLFLTSPIVILCLQRDSYSLSFLTFFACSKSYFDKSIILLCLCLIGSNEMYEVVRWLNWMILGCGVCLFGSHVHALGTSFGLCAPQTSKPQSNNKTNI